ncbi:MAG: hypothetical protein QOF51_95 [Chloroflexota bacterium]|jgi:ubiquinone/menaquinone biosynthesis C-methylase UbiE|nr:hypothetical protein [Chloroflexota bacterium]
MVDLYAGAAACYARYRPGYPPQVLDRVRSAFGLHGIGRLLDVGCGTGQLVLALHRDVHDALAIDISPEMLAEAERARVAIGAANVQLRCLAAEEISPSLGSFRLVTFGSSLHWMHRYVVLLKSYALTEPGGGVAIVASDSIWSSEQPFALIVRAVVQRWLGPERQTLAGAYAASSERHEDVLARTPFVDIQVSATEWDREADADAIIGELYSTSFANRALFGDHAAGFEEDLRHALLALDSRGRFVVGERTHCILARKR